MKIQNAHPLKWQSLVSIYFFRFLFAWNCVNKTNICFVSDVLRLRWRLTLLSMDLLQHQGTYANTQSMNLTLTDFNLDAHFC